MSANSPRRSATTRHPRVWPRLAALAGSLMTWLAATASPTDSLVTEEFLDAVAEIESGKGRQNVGDGGQANGWWQMHEAAWQDVSARRLRCGWPVHEYGAARIPEVAREYARDYCLWLESLLRRHFADCLTPEMLYAAYNLGYASFSRRHFSLSSTPSSTQKACRRLRALLREAARPEATSWQLAFSE